MAGVKSFRLDESKMIKTGFGFMRQVNFLLPVPVFPVGSAMAGSDRASANPLIHMGFLASQHFPFPFLLPAGKWSQTLDI